MGIFILINMPFYTKKSASGLIFCDSGPESMELEVISVPKYEDMRRTSTKDLCLRTPVLFHMQGDIMEGDSPRILVRPHAG